MKKSPLSTQGGQGGNFYRGRGRQRGYGYNQMRSNDNYRRFSGPNNGGNNQFEGDMIPLETSSPTFYHNNRGNRRHPNERHNQRFSNTGISGSYNQGQNSYRNNFQPNTGKPYTPQNFQRNQQFQQKKDRFWYRKIPISEFVDFKKMKEDPWADLMAALNVKIEAHKAKTVTNDSSVEIICERNPLEDSSSASTSDGATINISSSYEVTEGSSVDLPLEGMNFEQESKDNSISSSSIMSQGDESPSEKANQSQDDSVVMLN